MPHQIGEQCNIIILLQKVLGVSVPERMRIHNLWIQFISDRIILKLLGNTAHSNSVTKPIEKHIALNIMLISTKMAENISLISTKRNL